MKKAIVAISGAFAGLARDIKMLFGKQEPEKAPVIAPIAPKKIVVQIDISDNIPGLEAEFMDPANWEHECYVQMDGDFERLIRKPNRINKKLSYRKKKSQAKNWDKWKRKGVN